jgi:mannose-6-phosphate isomerase
MHSSAMRESCRAERFGRKSVPFSTGYDGRALAMKLRTQLVEKPWGRTDIPPMFSNADGRKIGEVWFSGDTDEPLLLKWLFTSERLSVQVHPNDAQAHERGLPRGKTECWYIVNAEPSATLGLGLVRKVSEDELRAAALDGSIERLLNWRPVRAGEFFFVPPCTIHAIGGGLTLIEFQQNADVTYRLYDYGRPRELHLSDGVAVARPEPYPSGLATVADAPNILVDGPEFTLVHAVDGVAPADALSDRRRWVIPVEGNVTSGAESAGPGECLIIEPGAQLDFADARILIGSEGSA